MKNDRIAPKCGTSMSRMIESDSGCRSIDHPTMIPRQSTRSVVAERVRRYGCALPGDLEMDIDHQ